MLSPQMECDNPECKCENCTCEECECSTANPCGEECQ